jgi:RNA polymerase sigma factor (sigma-70 family)
MKRNPIIKTYSTIKNRYYTRKQYDYNDDTTNYRECNHFIPLKSVDKVATYQVIQKEESYKYQKEDALFKSTELSVANDMTSEIDLDSIVAKNQIKEKITQALTYLTPKEERVIRMRFGIGLNTDYTLEEVGQPFSVTRNRIMQIEAKALRKLNYYCKDFKELLEVV